MPALFKEKSLSRGNFSVKWPVCGRFHSNSTEAGGFLIVQSVHAVILQCAAPVIPGSDFLLPVICTTAD
jgi:hypothetical protein